VSGDNRLANRHKLYTGPITAVATPSSINISPVFTDIRAGVRYYSNAAGDVVDATGGTVALDTLDEVTNEYITMGTALDATDELAKLTVSATSTQVRATPASVLTATHYQLFVSANV
jgi:hypothetical protein